MLSYKENVKEIIWDYPNFSWKCYDYASSDLNEEYNNIYLFAQENLLRDISGYGTNKAKFFFVDSDSINARGGWAYGLGFVSINRGLIESLHSSLLSEKSLIQNISLKGYAFDFNINRFLFDFTTHFIYYHELTHVIQHRHSKAANYNEIQAETQDNEFNIESHLREFDADFYATHFLALIILRHWKYLLNIGSINITLNQIVEISIAAIIFYFSKLVPDMNVFYIRDKQHPHPIIRIIRISEGIVGNINKNSSFNLNKREIVDNAFKLFYNMQSITKLPDKQSSVINLITLHEKEIASYYEEIQKAQKTYPNLVTSPI